MNGARQLCRASQSMARTRTVSSCPVCGRKIEPREHVWFTTGGTRERRPVIPAHVRDESGEAKVRRLAERTRYPGTS